MLYSNAQLIHFIIFPLLVDSQRVVLQGKKVSLSLEKILLSSIWNQLLKSLHTVHSMHDMNCHFWC